MSSVDSSKPAFSKAILFRFTIEAAWLKIKPDILSRMPGLVCVQTVPKDQMQTTIASKALIMLSEDHYNMTA